MRAELRLICRCHRLGILLVRKPVIVPVVGIDAAIDTFDVVRPSHKVAVAAKLDPAWNLVRVTRRGVAEIGEVVLVEGKKPGFAVEVR